jgi:hypothetical protein
VDLKLSIIPMTARPESPKIFYLPGFVIPWEDEEIIL